MINWEINCWTNELENSFYRSIKAANFPFNKVRKKYMDYFDIKNDAGEKEAMKYLSNDYDG